MNTRACAHCGGYCDTNGLAAVYARAKFNNQVGTLLALPVNDNIKFIHSSCLKNSLDEFIQKETKLWQSPEPKRCATCDIDIIGDLIWRIEKIEDGDTKYPFTYLCSSCGDTHVFGE